MATTLQDFAVSVIAVVEPETTAQNVAKLMRQRHVSAVVVVEADQHARPVGIVTDRDLVRELMAEDMDPALFTAGDVMVANPVFASPSMDALEAVQLMRSLQLQQLLIADSTDRLLGVAVMEEVLERLAFELISPAADGGRANGHGGCRRG
ncbi:CBS domain-containing protein [Rhodoferax sp.]|uniref:CBS domain-containing protein n=1 Tax=Rhodoferax sp. TaxID=50421 RepID=UPI00275FAADE|nr:CBS domain-containing protein [Rhodoferax sp.]